MPRTPRGCVSVCCRVSGDESTVLPNNSLKLTRRAALPVPLAWPVGRADNSGESARFRRAA
jgi:hypothetical protein